MLTRGEQKRAYNRIYNKCRREKLYGGNRERKGVILLYPGCAEPDQMSKTEFRKWKAEDFPEGTQIIFEV
jgi:hypothetical protein